MRKIVSLFMLAAMLFFGVNAMAAAKGKAEIVKAGAEVKTAFFEVTIPQGWMMPAPVRDMPNGAVAAVFATENRQVAVAITAMKAEMDAKTIAEQTAVNMRKGNMEATDPVEKNGFYVVEMQPKAKKDPKAVGIAIFGSNGKECTVTTITGTDVKKADELLGAIKPLNGVKFPATAQ